MKRILIFSLTYFPYVGGAEVAVKEITDRLRFKDVSFDMVTLRFDSALPERERVGNVTVHRIGLSKKNVGQADIYRFPLSLNKYLFPFLAYLKARQLHAEHFYGVLWSIQANYAGFAALFTKSALPHVPFVLTLQEGDPPQHYLRRVGPLRGLYRKIFLRADTIHTISTFLATFAKTMGYRGHINVIPNGVDITRFAEEPSENAQEILKKRLNKKKGEVYLVTVSRLVRKNAVDDLIRALSYLPKHAKLIVIGEGPDGRALWKLAEREGVEERVWFAGHVAQEDMPLYLHVCDIFVRPSRSEGQGISFIEAMAAGLPIIATPVGGITDFLFDPEQTKLGKVTPTGLFCTVDDPESIARAVERLLADDTLREAIIKHGKAMVEEKYDWNTIAGALYEKVLTETGTRCTTR